ncbi:MAG: peptidase M28 [Verrucomicrobiales bacterium]|nr:peptidase M28 [Verrucomicrobiales bacterium]
MKPTTSILSIALFVSLFASGNDEATFISNTRQLIYEGRRSGEGYYSADGNAMVFQSEREPGNPFYQIYFLDLTTGDSHRISPGHGKTTCAFLRPGTKEVLFGSTHHDVEARAKQKKEIDFRNSGKSRRYSWDYDETMDIFVGNRDGKNLRRLTSAMGYDAEAAYSPDGSKIVFCSLRSAFPLDKLSKKDHQTYLLNPSHFGEIYIMNADGSGQKRLTNTRGYDGGPFFSPDGKRIIWRRFNEKGDMAEVHTMKTDGSDVRKLTSFNAMSWAPYYHPSGEYVIFTANKFGFANFELFIVDARGEREPVRVTHTDGFDGLPVFSPDGTKLCWTSNRTSDKKSQLFLGNWNHAAALTALNAAPERKITEQIAASHSDPHAPLGLTTAITEADLKTHVGFLADEKLEGRLTGTKGAEIAANFVAANFKQNGLTPKGEKEFFQPFSFNAGVKIVDGKNTLNLDTAYYPNGKYELNKEFRPLSFTANGEVEGEVVFAGYGLTMPGAREKGYNSYTGLNVSNKIVLVLRYVPEDVSTERRQALNRYAGLRYKALIARNNGAKAIIVVTGPNSPNAGKLASLTYETGASGSGIIAASISGEVAQKIFTVAHKDLKKIQTELDRENPHAETGFAIPRLKLRIGTGIRYVKKTDRNVIGVIPSKGTDEYILLGAHYDHLGRGETGGFARKDEEGKVHNGADDNASGTAAILELAAELKSSLAPQKKHRGVIFAAWSGEEMGLMGSAAFAKDPTVPNTNIVAYLNFDMVGRLRDNKLTLQGVGSSSVWKKMIEQRNVVSGFSLTLQSDPYLPTDTTSFYPKGIPVLAFFTGSHEEYHRPADKPDTLNYSGLERITKFARLIARDLVLADKRPDYVKVKRQDKGGSRDRLRAYLGTIPDYAGGDVKGVKISGTRAGAPADKGGMKGGDIIVEFGGQKIENIYDYTYAIDAVKIGKPVKVVVERGKKRVTLTITPEARK